jgi:dihydrofolate synthase/folylpolyglutamate synthase
MNYKQAYDYLNSFTNYEKVPGINYALEMDGLDRVRLLMRLVGKPQSSFKSLVIAGTKGKGSVAAMLASMLREAGHRAGLYTSPHLHTFRERIRVDGEMISPDDMARIVQGLQPVVEKIKGLGVPEMMPTTYELATALAFLYFKEKEVEVAVLEVGLGGRLDAVNVVEPVVSIITSISLDHTQVLGNTLEAIAKEKAGIIKQGGHVISAPQEVEAATVIERVVECQGAHLITVGKEAYISTDQLPKLVSDEDGLPSHQIFTVAFANTEGTSDDIQTSVNLPLLGNHQQVNAAVAMSALPILVEAGIEMDREAMLSGLLNVEWPGRMEIVKRSPVVVVDGAHNVESMEKLHDAVAQLFHRRNVVVVLGIGQDKDIQGMLEQIGGWSESILGPLVERVIVTRSEHPRAADPQEVARQAVEAGLDVEIERNVRAALERAEALAETIRTTTGNDVLVLVTGSLFIVAEAREHYGLAPDLSEER